ncbi:MAG: glycoside hydrolase family 2 protein [Acidimicrobiia bacterium]
MTVDLSGMWRLCEAEGDLHQRFTDPGFDDSAWTEWAVPGHWRSVPELERSDGPVLYRRRFAVEPVPGQRSFLVLDGVFYYGDVWLDGAYLGATEGYFAPHAFEITDALAGGGEHVLAIEVACPPERDGSNKRMVTGVFSHWDNLDPKWNPGGLWRPVHVASSGPVRLARLRALCTETTEDRGRLGLDLTLDAAAGPATARLRARLTGPGVDLVADRDQTLAAGENQLSWTLEVDRPPRWWPWRYGDQPLCDLDVDVEVDGARSDGRRLRTAFREVRLDNWRLHVNGERIFVMGTNQGPTRMALAESTTEDLAADVARAREANLDMVRLHAHVGRPELYAAADEAGVLLWQDLPLQWGYGRGARKPAAAQARALVDLAGHHPSVALWCGHNEPFPGPSGEPGAGRSRTRAAASLLLPSWNKDVLDRSVARALSRSDPTRPVVDHSGVLPGVIRGGTDSHFYLGWYSDEMGDLAETLRRWPRLGRFVSEFGAQAVPERADFMEPKHWPNLDWPRLIGRHCLQKRIFDRRVPPDEYATFEDWRAATQAYQAALIQLQAEDLRRLRYRPTGGFLQFCFADGAPGVTWSVLDHDRVPKAGFGALRDACRSVLPMLDPRTGALHVANELRRPLAGAVIEARLGGGEWRFTGDVAADSLAFVGRVEMPEGVSVAEVTLTHDDVGVVVNRYDPTVLAAASAGR